MSTNRDSTIVFVTNEEGGETKALKVHSILLPNGLVYDSHFLRHPQNSTRQKTLSLKQSKVFRRLEDGDIDNYNTLTDMMRRGKVEWLKDGSKTG